MPEEATAHGAKGFGTSAQTLYHDALDARAIHSDAGPELYFLTLHFVIACLAATHAVLDAGARPGGASLRLCSLKSPIMNARPGAHIHLIFGL
jgi:hypothetical protein